MRELTSWLKTVVAKRVVLLVINILVAWLLLT